MNRLLTALCGGLLLFACPAFGASLTATPASVYATLKGAVCGDTVTLQPGQYGAQSYRLFSYACPITVTAQPGAAFDSLTLDTVSNMTWQGLEVTGLGTNSVAVTIANSSNVRAEGFHVHGNGGGTGFSLRDGANLAVVDSEIDHMGSGLNYLDGTGVTITGNRFHDIETDGVIGAGNQVRVCGNRFTDFYPTPDDHPDAIQAFSSAATPSPTGLTICDNVITRGAGLPIQGIFIAYTTNVSISGNAMAGTMINGISLAGSKTATVAGNLVQGSVDGGARIIVRDGSADVAVIGNSITEPVVNLHQAGGLDNANFTESGNTLIAPAAVGDTSALDRWLVAKGGTVTPDPTPTPVPPAPPPVVTPPVVVDSRDEKISSLTAQLAAQTATANASASQVTALTTQVASLTKAANDNAALLSAANGKVTTLTAQVASLTAQVNASSVTTLKAQIASLNKKISNAQSALK